MVTYSVCICNYNMAETLEESLRSVLDQVDERFEVIVVDGGSTDGSISILERLDAEYEIFRFLALPPDDDRKLGMDRHISVKEARGEYVLLHIDCDDRFNEGIVNFAEVYRQIDQQVDFQFGMTGSHITIAPREFILEIGSYRNVQAAEDLDLWRRMMAEDGFISLDCELFWEKIGYEKSYREKVRRILEMRTSEFQLGMSYWSRIRRAMQHDRLSRGLFDVVVSTVAYGIAQTKEQYEMPDDMDKYEVYVRERKKRTMTLEEIEAKYGVDINKKTRI